MRTRDENGFRNVTSKNGTFTPHISRATTERVTRYCKNTNTNRTKFVEACINDRLDVLEDKYLQGLSKEELIAIIKQS